MDMTILAALTLFKKIKKTYKIIVLSTTPILVKIYSTTFREHFVLTLNYNIVCKC